LRIVFLGTPDFSVVPLKGILESGKDEIVAVCTNKDKPVGRKHILTPSPVKRFASDNGIKVFEYDRIRNEGVDDLKELAPDLMITCAFGQILSEEILNIPKYGVFNIHASLLPAYRGASPIQAAILNGESETGITIMQTDIGIDDGDIILQEKTTILPDETAGELFDRLSQIGKDCIIKALDKLRNGQIVRSKQDPLKATFCRMIKKEDAEIDWSLTADEIVNKIRAYNPSPIAFTPYKGETLNVYKAHKGDLTGKCGEILSASKSLVIGCKNGSVSLDVLQKSGGKALEIKQFLCGYHFNVGEFLG